MRGMAKSLGDYLAGYEWDHWVTLTPSRPSCGPNPLAATFERRFIRKLERAAQHHLCWARALERSPAGIFHVHALLAGTRNIREAYITSAWDLGKADVERYDPQQGAAWYLAKTYGQPSEYWERFDCSRHMPPERGDRRAA